MTKEQLAEKLNGREYGEEITRDEAAQAKEHGLVVVYGTSDDLMEFYGAIHDEKDCWGGGTVYFDEEGQDDCPYIAKAIEGYKTIEAKWCAPDSPSWTYETDIPHATFDIMEDGEVYCRGIVFEISALSRGNS